MPRKPRIEIAGYYHIVNRGVEQRTVFLEADDYEYFEELLCFYLESYNIILHNYCLMSNHYHLLIEIEEENLSKFMKQLNANYAIYFNKKYGRTGHLWQGRFKSWYVTDEAYLYTLMIYIEQNPLKANMIQELGEYPYSSYHYFLESTTVPLCLRKSWIVQNFNTDVEGIEAFFNASIDTAVLQELKKASSLLAVANVDRKPNEEVLRKLLTDTEDKKKRNIQILQAYKKGYSQHMIAKVLGLSQPTVNGIIKRTEKSQNSTTIATKKDHMKMTHKKAFTMIELIFVIVIIGILAAIAIPKLAATRDDAAISQIVANERLLLQDFQNYYTSQGNSKWLSEDITKVTSVYLDETTCGNPVDISSDLSPNTFVLCHDNIICLSFTTIDEGNLTIADGTVTTDAICEAVKAIPASMSISNKSYKLAGQTVER